MKDINTYISETERISSIDDYISVTERISSIDDYISATERVSSTDDYINEKFQVSVDDIRNREDYTDEELRDDYETVSWAYTKKEKIEMGDKYGVTDYRIRPIQLEILDRLRENRFEKSEFT